MNKPERPEIFNKAGDLLKRAADAGGSALKSVGDAGAAAWNRATDAPDEAGKRRKTLIILGGGIAAIIAVLFVMSRLGGDGAVHTPVSTAQAVSVITVAPRGVTPTISLNGEARPVRDIQVSAPTSGVRVIEILVDEGDNVRAGQAMARLDTNVAEAQIQSAQASVAEAESSAIRARGEYERAESIRDSGALSAEAIEQRRAAAVAADARLAAARAQAREVNARLGGGYVRAPAAGLVIDRAAEVGRNVDGQVLFRIAADNRLEVAAQIAEADALALEVGQTAQFTLVDGSTVMGTLRRGPASIDSRTRTGEALFSLPAGTRVRAGMYLRGVAHLAERSVAAIPQSSVLYDNGQAYVYIVGDDNVVRRTEVQLGARDGEYIEILSGVDLGQRVVGAGAAFLQDGEEVRAIATEATAAPAATAPVPPEQNLRGREG